MVTILTLCIALMDYNNLEIMEVLKKRIAECRDFKAFISPQYAPEPKYDIYAVCDSPYLMITKINSMVDLRSYIKEMNVLAI